MDLVERMAVVEGRLDRVERVLGLSARRGAPTRESAQGTTPPMPRGGARGEVVLDLREDPATAVRDGAVPIPSRAAEPALLPAPVSGSVPGSIPAPVPAPVPVSVPATPAPPRSSVPAPRPSTRRKLAVPAPGARGDMERFVGVTILGRVGIAAVLLAAGYFAQLAYASFPPALRVASIYALSGVLILVGALVRSRVAPRYVGILWGGGVAAAYMAGVVARIRYDLFPEAVATGALVASCALGQVLAKSLKQRTLALVALAGAIGAPVLVGGPADARTPLLVYLLTLNAWAWFIERHHGATGARRLAVLGVSIVALLWFFAHGGSDVSTWVHLHLYLFGLSFPEWGSVMRGRGLPRNTAILTAFLCGVAELWFFGLLSLGFGHRADPSLIHRFLLVAGLAWAVPPVLGRLRTGEARTGSAELTHLAGACVAVGLFFFAGDPLWSGLVGHRVVLGASAAFALLAIRARRTLGAGELAATLASALSLLLLVSLDPRDPARLFAFVGPLALLLFATHPRVRVAALPIAVAAAFGGILADPSPWRPVVCLAMAAAALWIASARARRLRDEVLGACADLVLVALVGFGAWAALERGALAGAFQVVAPAFLNPGTAAAVVLAAALVLRLRAGPRATTRATDSEPILRVVLGALLVAAGGREVRAALLHVEALDLRAALGALYLAATAPLFFFAARRRRDALLAFEGIVVLAIGVALALTHGHLRGRAWTSGAELAGLVAAGGAGIWFLRTFPAAVRASLAALALGIAASWVGHVAGGRFDLGAQFFNARSVVATLVVALLVAARGRTTEPALRLVHLALGLAAAGLAFGAGLVEVLQAVRDLPSGPIRSVLVSVYATGFSAVLLFVGFRRRSLEVRWLALAGFAAVVLKVGLHDLSNVETPWRILVTGCLGVVLLGAAYAYARRDRGAPLAAGAAGPAGDDPLPPPPTPPAS